jgi:hypothetical protein
VSVPFALAEIGVTGFGILHDLCLVINNEEDSQLDGLGVFETV